MKKILKVLVIILLLGILGFEVYMYFFKEDNDVSFKEKEKNVKLETKYLVDIYTGYRLNGINFEYIKEGDRLYYQKISGLKNKELEEKINNRIKEKVHELEKIVGDKKSIISGVLGNYENSLSMAFCAYDVGETPVEEIAYCSYFDMADMISIDLTTGKDVTIYDVVNSKEVLKALINEIGYDTLAKSIGFVCAGGPCENPDPDYSTIEDDLFSLISKYQKDDFTLGYDANFLFIKFKNVNITLPQPCHKEDEKGCKKYTDKYDNVFYINQHGHVSEYKLTIPLIKLVDNLTIYDKFKTKDSIYEKDGQEVSIKFSNPDDYSSPQMIENDNSLVDYNILYYPSEERVNSSDSIKKSLLKEMKAIETKNFNIYDIFGNTSTISADDDEYYDYVYFDVRHYDMPKSVYEKFKKKIYVEKSSKVIMHDGYGYKTTGEGETRDYGYDFLKDYLDRKAFFYYVYDKDGRELDTKEFMSYDYLTSIIPDSWLSLGNYSSISAMIDDSLLMLNNDHKYPNKLVIEDDGVKTINLKYKNKSKTIADDFEQYDQVIDKLYK